MPTQVTKGYQCSLSIGGGVKSSVGDVILNRTAPASEANTRAGAGFAGVVSGLRRWSITAKAVGNLALSEGDLVAVVITGPNSGNTGTESRSLGNGYGVVTAVNETQNLGDAVMQDVTIEGPAAYV